MFGKTATVAVKIIADSRDAVRGLSDTGSKFGKVGKIAGVAGAGLAVAGGAAVKFGLDALQSASDLQQSAGAVNDIFKSGAGQMRKFASQAATSVGLSKNEYNELASVIGSQLKNGGTSMDKLAGKTNSLISTGADLSAMFGGTTKEAVEALSSALKGERDPIERYGVSLKQSSIDAEAARLGFKKVGGSLSTEANQAATLSLIMKQTADAHGKFGKESDTLAGKQQRLGAKFENLKSDIGSKLLPVVTSFFGFLDDKAIPALSGVWDWVQKLDFGSLLSDLGGMQGVTSSASSGFDKIKSALSDAWTQAQPLIATIRDELIPNFVKMAQTVLPPLISAITGIVPPLISAAVAVFGLSVAIWQKLQPVITGLLPVVTTIFTAVGNIIKAALAVVTAVIKTATALIKGDWSGVWSGMKQIVSTTWNLIKTIIKSALSVAKSLLSAGLAGLKSVMSSVWDGIKSVVSSAWGRIKTAVINGASNVVSEVKKLPGKAKNALSGLGSLLRSAGVDLVAGFINGIIAKAGDIVGVIKRHITDKIPGWVKNPLGIFSPSRVMIDIAKWIPAGIASGIEGNAGVVRKAMGKLSGDVAGTRMTLPTITGDGPIRGAGAGTASGSRPAVQITIQGALDPLAVARQIRELLADYDVLVGA